MITKDMIRCGIENGIISICDDSLWSSCGCKIGGYWFCFDVTDLSTNEYLKYHSMNEIIDNIFDTLEDFRVDEWDEYKYYLLLLKENLHD